MRKLIDIGNRYAHESTWRDYAVTKLCLFSMGLAAGTQVSEKYKKTVLGVSACAFAVTYIPLMTKLIGMAVKQDGCKTG